jgi:hypothetical protein
MAHHYRTDRLALAPGAAQGFPHGDCAELGRGMLFNVPL